jgi:regulator of replication initiation timing
MFLTFQFSEAALAEKLGSLKSLSESLQLENTALKARLLKTVNDKINAPAPPPVDNTAILQKVAGLENENEKLIQNNCHLCTEMQKINAENETLIDENQVLKKYLDDINLLSSQLYSYSRIK